MSFVASSIGALQRGIASRVRARRLALGWSRTALGIRAGVSSATLKHFENSGQVSLRTLLRLASALGAAEDFDRLFAVQGAMPASIAELERLQPVARKRGRTVLPPGP
jgi:transcriptional regulator with XRE-family HTH domain